MSFDYNNPQLDELDLTRRQRKILEAIRTHPKSKDAAAYLGVNYNTFRRNMQDLRKKMRRELADTSEQEKPLMSGSFESPKRKRGSLDGNTFIFTHAQNNTHSHKQFLKSLEIYADVKKAKIVIGTSTYAKNEYQRSEKSADGLHYDDLIQKYIIDEELQVAKDLIWCGNLNILPTAVNPLSGFKNYRGDSSIIVPHVKMELECGATAADRDPKFMFTTGSITQRNYIQKKAGQKAEEHHIFSALVVEVDDDGDWWARHLNCETSTGEFYDLGVKYTPEGIKIERDSVEAVNMPDIHIGKIEDSQLTPHRKMLNELNPRYILAHDTHDHSARNHHNIDDPYFRFDTYHNGKESVKDEVLKSVKFLTEFEQYCRDELVVVESNHDLALERWLKSTDYRKDPVNAIFFLQLQLHNYQKIESGVSLSTFKDACEIADNGKIDGVRFLTTDEPFVVAGINCEQHGHNGPGGARGSIANYVTTGARYNRGHGHIAGYKNGVAQAGVIMTPEQAKYSKGMSAWSNTSIITHKNSKRQLVTIKKGKFKR